MSRVCRSIVSTNKGLSGHGGARQQGSTRVLEMDQEPEEAPTYFLYNLSKGGSRAPITLRVRISGASLLMEVDTGSVVSIINECTYKSLWAKTKRPWLQHSSINLRTYTGERIKVKGSICVDVYYGGTTHSLSLLVVEGNGPSLMGRDWLVKLKPNISVFYAGIDGELEKLLEKHGCLFKEELGCVKDVEVKIQVDSLAKPRFFRPRAVPFALRERVEKELERLQKDGIIEPVAFSDWAAPVVPVVKHNGSLRICGDYKLTVNSVANIESYPLPRIDDLLASLAGGKVFSKLDLSHAYLQLALAEESKKFVTISTHKGLFQYNRMPFGVASAPAIFQRTMEGILQGIPHVHVYIDDILVADTSKEEHLKTLEMVLSRLEKYGIKLKRAKCKFMLPSVEYLGYHISGEGIRPTEEKRRAIVDAPVPQDVTQLKSFLGLVNYYSKFLPCLSHTLAPLYRLLSKHQQWGWGPEQSAAFQKAKSQLASDLLLTHFDPSKKIVLSCDASPYGIGAVLSHMYEDGSDRPIAFASRSLAPAEKNYSQIEKEGLAVVWGVRKFHQFLFGREFVIYSDHKPLQFLFSERKSVPTMASSRIQRWALTLSAYKYQLVFRAGKEQGNSDGLSRLPLSDTPDDVPLPADTVLMLQSLPEICPVITAASIKYWTDRDPILSAVRGLVLQGWTSQCKGEFIPYEQRKAELSVMNGCVLWGNRVVVPPPGRARIVNLLHEGHPGITRMKTLARSYLWWPGLDGELENKVRSCQACQVNSKLPPKSPLHGWEWPSTPWCRIHVDFCGPFLGKTIFVLVDAHSKWIEAEVVSSPTTQNAIHSLRKVFASHGLPEVLVSDNGPAFTSKEFQTFVQRNGFRHIKSAPYHPATNGLAERAVQTVKSALKKVTGDMETNLLRFLFQYRLTPHSTTGQSPAELLLGRRPRSHLDFIVPSVERNVKKAQERQRNNCKSSGHHCYEVGERVYALNHWGTPRWISGIVTSVMGPASLRIKLDIGKEVRYHVDNVKPAFQPCSDDGAVGDEFPLPAASESRTHASARNTATPPPVEPTQVPPLAIPEVAPPPPQAATTSQSPMSTQPPTGPLRRSTRPHRPPERFGL